jgi:hypothetical protein
LLCPEALREFFGWTRLTKKRRTQLELEFGLTARRTFLDFLTDNHPEKVRQFELATGVRLLATMTTQRLFTRLVHDGRRVLPEDCPLVLLDFNAAGALRSRPS